MAATALERGWLNCNPTLRAQEEFYRLGGHVTATALLLWCGANEPPAPAPGKDDFHLEAGPLVTASSELAKRVP